MKSKDREPAEKASRGTDFDLGELAREVLTEMGPDADLAAVAAELRRRIPPEHLEAAEHEVWASSLVDLSARVDAFGPNVTGDDDAAWRLRERMATAWGPALVSGDFTGLNGTLPPPEPA
jgi:hypothetical protein